MMVKLVVLELNFNAESYHQLITFFCVSYVDSKTWKRSVIT